MHQAGGTTYRPHGVLPDYYGSAEERRPFVDRLFNEGAPHYERINRWMSFGTGELYRRDALERSGLLPGMRVLDVATGTGVLARAALAVVGRTGSVLGLDPSPGMLHEARGIAGLRRLRGLAESLPIASGCVDFLSMGYALRHVADLQVTFREYHRALRPGGRLLLLELVPPQGRFSRVLVRFYLKRLVPWLTCLGAKRRGARTMMEYFWDTIDACVPPEIILQSLREAGFAGVERQVIGGFLAEYRAQRPE
jgi:demethylmenaquinone methyltransferase/2-methoxy-6-polyprenyl-1,4-benzoquinol methylase